MVNNWTLKELNNIRNSEYINRFTKGHKVEINKDVEMLLKFKDGITDSDKIEETDSLYINKVKKINVKGHLSALFKINK